MTQERIDIEAYIQQFTAVDEIDETEQLTSAGLAAIAELKRCYEEIDYLVDMLHKLGYYGKNISEEKQLEWEEASE